MIALCLVIFFLVRKGISDGSAHSENRGQGGAVRSDDVIAILMEPPRDPRLELQPNGGQPLAKETIRAFVNEEGHSPEAISWAYLLTYDPSYLEDLKKHTDSAHGLRMLAQFDVGEEFRLHWAEQLIKKDPANGLGHILKARALVELGEADTAVGAYDKALETGNFETPRSDLQNSMLKLLEKVPSEKRTAFAIHALNSAQAMLPVMMFPDNYKALFKDKPIEQGKEAALNILRLQREAQQPPLIDIQGFRELRDPVEGGKLKILMDFGKQYGDEATKLLDPQGDLGAARLSSARVNQLKSVTWQLSPAEVERRVNSAIQSVRETTSGKP